MHETHIPGGLQSLYFKTGDSDVGGLAPVLK